MSEELLTKKLEYWGKQLLDLGKRNKMINYRETRRSTLRLVEPSFEELFRRIALDEEKLTFQRAVDRETDVRVYSLLSLLENLSSPLPVTIGDIGAEGSMMERQKTLKNMRAKARLAQEEQGTNILYLSFGFIEWTEGRGASARRIKSPLVLVPAVLSLESLNSPFVLSKYDDDIVVNPTLQYYLKTEYGIDLPSFDEDEESLDDYLKKIEEIADRRGWRILREVSLGLLSFLKITMYNDLQNNRERILSNPVIRAMSGDGEEVNRIPPELEGFDLDSVSTRECYQVMSADSSQQDAILYSKNGVSFVMEGPPGTGKSQTITNIVAEALAAGKTVLFVSEKMAALQVVYRRLCDVGLGDFCLPLHSHKANKKEVLAQLGASLSMKQERVKDTAIAELEELHAIRRELNAYAEELHRLNLPLGMTCYEVYSKLEEHRTAPTVLFAMADPATVSRETLQQYLSVLQEYELSVQRLGGDLRHNPWEGLRTRVTGFEYTERMRTEVTRVQELAVTGAAFSKPMGLSLTYDRVGSFAEGLQLLGDLPTLPACWLEQSVEGLPGVAAAGKSCCQRLDVMQKELDGVFRPTVYGYDYLRWKEEILRTAETVSAMPILGRREGWAVIDHSTEMTAALRYAVSSLQGVCDAYGEIDRLLGTQLTPSANSMAYLTALAELLGADRILRAEWFTADLRRAKTLITEAQQHTKQLKTLRGQILAAWDQRVFSLDYFSLLTRFKTAYLSPLRFLNAEYHRDKKLLRGYVRTPVRSLDNETVLALLEQLNAYHTEAAWLTERAAELHALFAERYRGEDTDWEDLSAAIAVAERLGELPGEGLSPQLMALVTADHRAQAKRLADLLVTANTNYARATERLSRNGLDWAAVTAGQEAAQLLEVCTAALDELVALEEKTAQMKPHLLDETKSLEEVCIAVDRLQRYLELEEEFNAAEEEHKRLFGKLYLGRRTDWDRLLQLLETLQALRSHPLYPQLKQELNCTASRRTELLTMANTLRQALEETASSARWLFDQFDTMHQMPLHALADRLDLCLQQLPVLERWIDLLEARDRCVQAGLGEFITNAETAGNFSDIRGSFLKGFYRMWLDDVCMRLSAVRRFRKNTQTERIEKFVELDDRQLQIARKRIREKLIDELPAANRLVRATDEVAILNRELGKRRNFMPLRKLFRRIPNLLMRLKPCLMMSPLSVSYFLETEAYHFDLVIFDEASQIFPEDAIGAIFRGSQVIITGDSKQLPPTNFFAAATNNADNDYDLDSEDLEETVSDSILEEAASVLPKRTLLWHYRSKHESLISFSNREIYGNQLITFPNTVGRVADMGVEYVYVEDGYYESGGKNCNLREAQRCVELVAEHIAKYPDRSLGIIAFSEKQQTAIENAIVEYREAHPECEEFFRETKDEPFFIKNLENVQGDERDTIIFSICYAKDRNGRMYMRFGPLGHDGGERRLNVAITRAKCNVKLVGSILPSDIDLKRTQAEGVRMLRSYIEFARRGESGVAASEAGHGEDPFVESVAAFLRQNGYTVRRRVGDSDYKIDIGVLAPGSEEEFLAGIECDGYSYVRARTARDRDHLRRSVLQSMGWNLYRVWSTEWQRDPRAEGEALLAFLRSLVDHRGKVLRTLRRAAPAVGEAISETVEREQAEAETTFDFPYYIEADWRAADPGRPVDGTTTARRILYVVGVEQPIHLDLLYKRMVPALGATKVTEAVRMTVQKTISGQLQGKVTVEEDFVRLLPLAPVQVRIPDPYDPPRPMEYIHTAEVAVAMLEIVRGSFGITVEGLAAETARLFGFERMGPKIRAKTDAAIRYLEEQGAVRIIEGKAQLTGE